MSPSTLKLSGGLFFIVLSFTGIGYSETTGSRVAGDVQITTDAVTGKVSANNEARVYLSSVSLSGSAIQSGGLAVTTTTTANSVTASSNADVSIASLLMNDSAVGSVSKPITLEAHVEDVTAAQNARLDISSISMNGSTISGNLTLDDKIYTKAGNITVGENGSAAVASLLMNDSSASNVTIGKMSAVIDDLKVEDNAKAHISSLEMNNVHAGDVTFSADTRLGGTATASAGGNLNVNSVVLEGVNVSGPVSYDLNSNVRNGIEVSGEESEAMVGGVRIENGATTDGLFADHRNSPPLSPDRNDSSEEKRKIYSEELEDAYLSMCVYDKPADPAKCEEFFKNNKNIEKLTIYQDKSIGFKAEAYYRKSTDSYILAFAGTDGWQDWIFDNIPQFLGIATPQYTYAMQIASKWSEIADNRKKKLEFVGHSLGGGLATASSLLTGKEATTFNASYTDIKTVTNYLAAKYMVELANDPKELKAKLEQLVGLEMAAAKNQVNAQDLITAYTVKGEILKGKELGHRVHLDPPDDVKWNEMIDKHKIKLVVDIMEKQDPPNDLAQN